MEQQVIDAATLNLMIMDHNGELALPEPWFNGKGETIIPWTDQDGPVLACYMNMLGLDEPGALDQTSAALSGFRIPRGPRRA